MYRSSINSQIKLPFFSHTTVVELLILLDTSSAVVNACSLLHPDYPLAVKHNHTLPTTVHIIFDYVFEFNIAYN